MKTRLFAIFYSLLGLTVFGQEEIWMKPNAGQWHENVEYRISIPNGFMYLEKGGFTYQLTNYDHYHDGHGDHAGHHPEEAEELLQHVVKTKFLGSNPTPGFAEALPSNHVENYFLGNDPSKWVSGLTLYNEVTYLELYDGIDLKMYEKDNSLKYDVLVLAGTDPANFKVQYEGQHSLKIKQKALHIKTEFGTIVEGAPYAYQMIDGGKVEVPCEYVLEGNVMHFEFPDGYYDAYDLVIDPDLTFSTFTGSTADNWGMTACPDLDKRLVAAGIVFGAGYPLIGSISSFVGGATDLGVTKFSADGLTATYSTYIGGSGAETPHSIITNHLNELYIMGATSSANFPLGTGTPYDNSHAGGVTTNVNGVSFTGGTDIYVIRLNPTGSAITGGTFLGGTANDGISSGTVAFNYGDQLRGEVMVDEASNVYIASVSNSGNFPIVGGDNTLGGGQDAVVAKLVPNLSNLTWSTFLGGTQLESGNSVKLDAAGNIYVGGGTTSADFPNTTGQINPTYKGGLADGYVYKYEAPTYGTSIGTYIGTTDYDQVYFVELDPDDFVYIYGQSRGSYPITAGKYGNASSGQILHKMTNDLATTEWTSTFGASSGNEELSPTAFLVSDCYEIYIAGWGGNTNSSHSSAVNSSSNGMPITADAYQNTTNGSNFYLAQFEADMAGLKYSTYMGSLTTNGDHVDGGTSRFDKGGGIYHAVCGACGGNPDGFPIFPPTVFGPTNESPNCNMAAFLFELSKLDASIGIGSVTVCIPDPAVFDNTSVNGDTWFWDFGDGGTSTDFEPTHYYTTPGDYTVMLIVSHSSGCYEPDTAYLDVTIALLEAEAGTMIDTICPGSSVELWAIGGTSYSWGPADLLDDPTSANPIATIDEETTFTVTVTSDCGESVVDVTVYVHEVSAEAGGDTAICVGGSANIWASGGETYLWSPAASCDDPSSATPEVSPGATTYYIVEVTTVEGCVLYDTVKVHVDHDLPYPNLPDEVILCAGTTEQITAGGASDYIWTPDYNISATNVYNPYVWPTVDTTYHVTFLNACGASYDSVFVDVIDMVATASPDTTVCPGQEAPIWASGGVSYLWSPNSYISSTTDSAVMVYPWHETMYTCVVTDEYGCWDMVSVNITLHELPDIKVSPDEYAVVGDSVHIWAEGPGVITWTPPYNISCAHCADPWVWPTEQTTYIATVTDENGCKASAPVTIYFDPLIYVPNVFTPNGDGLNPIFHAVTTNIRSLEMFIFNRWGEIVWHTEDMNATWDGSYNGVMVKDDVYVWKILYTDLNGQDYELIGHVSVLK